MSLTRIAVTGRSGQIVTSLTERAGLKNRFEVVSLGRPDFDLSEPHKVDAAIRSVRPDIIVSAAAYTAVDQAESNEAVATVINGTSAGAIASTAADLGVPIIHLSTDYVFDGFKTSPYIERDAVGPTSAYGRSKLAGEKAIETATSDFVILRTAWVYSPFGANFLKTMLRLGETRDSINVVNDQIGNPTSAVDIADGILTVAENLLISKNSDLRGTFHMTGAGEASWADFAQEIFAASAKFGGRSAIVEPIPSSAYPTPAKRPQNSRLDCSLIKERHGIELPNWRLSTTDVVERLVKSNIQGTHL